jgi:hypothetical protein
VTSLRATFVQKTPTHGQSPSKGLQPPPPPLSVLPCCSCCCSFRRAPCPLLYVNRFQTLRPPFDGIVEAFDAFGEVDCLLSSLLLTSPSRRLEAFSFRRRLFAPSHFGAADEGRRLLMSASNRLRHQAKLTIVGRRSTAPSATSLHQLLPPRHPSCPRM